jgi:hypothetical protein
MSAQIQRSRGLRSRDDCPTSSEPPLSSSSSIAGTGAGSLASAGSHGGRGGARDEGRRERAQAGEARSELTRGRDVPVPGMARRVGEWSGGESECGRAGCGALRPPARTPGPYHYGKSKLLLLHTTPTGQSHRTTNSFFFE